MHKKNYFQRIPQEVYILKILYIHVFLIFPVLGEN